MIRKITGFLFILICIGCSTNLKPAKISPETTFSKENANGLIIGTVTFKDSRNKSPYDKYRFRFSYDSQDEKEKKANDTFFTINVNQFNGWYNGELNGEKTFPFVIEMKTGKYHFDKTQFFWNGGIVFQIYDNPVPFSLPLEVSKGEITYVGNLTIEPREKDKKPYIKISDDLNTLISYFKSKYANINWDSVKDNTFKKDEAGNGFVEFAN
jgi:hypothetical protein